MAGPNPWEELERPGPQSATVDGVQLRPGSRVVLRPRANADIMDLALTGRVGIVEGFDTDLEDNLSVAVTIEDDPGRDLGNARQPGHRFFFSLAEVEPLAVEAGGTPSGPRILVAGIGNVFLGDDGFGVELATRLAARPWPAGVQVDEFGIRGMDLAYKLQDGYDIAVFLDAAPRGGEPGELCVIEAEVDEGLVGLDTHGMDPVKVIALARALGAVPDRILVVACEPQTTPDPDEPELQMELSEPVRAALDPAVELVSSLVADLVKTPKPQEGRAA